MGLSGVSLGQILLVLFLFVIFFGSKRLGHVAKDLGAALRAFKEGWDPQPDHSPEPPHSKNAIPAQNQDTPSPAPQNPSGKDSDSL